jgi:DtxR family Mn-dependent transcriptional regulator
MIHAATDEVLEHLWYATEEERPVSSLTDLHIAPGESHLPDQSLQEAVLAMQLDGSIQPGNVWRLSPLAAQQARGIVRRHRLAEVLFVHAFGTALHEAEVSACEMEHMLSEIVTNRICAFLGHPPVCPHGKEVPKGDCCGVYSASVEPLITRLIDVPVGATASIAYIASKTSARIERLAAFGIIPGSGVQLIARRPSCVVSCGATSIALDDDIAREIYVVIPQTP